MDEETKNIINKEYARLNAVLYLEKVKAEFDKQHEQHFITIDKAHAIVNRFIRELEGGQNEDDRRTENQRQSQ